MPRIIRQSPLGLPPPPPGELNVTRGILTPTGAAEAHAAITRFLDYCRVSLIPGCPLSRWLDELEEARWKRDWRQAFAGNVPHDHRKAYDLIEAQRLVWSLRALLARGRPEPLFDTTFVRDQLMGEDYPEEAPELRMPKGVGSLFFAARLQQVSPGLLHFFGEKNQGADVEFIGDPTRKMGRVLIEQKERAYFKSRTRTTENLVEQVRGKITEAALGLAKATRSMPAGRVVLIGISPTVEHIDGVLKSIRLDVGRWCGDVMRSAGGDRSVIPHAVMVLAAAHGLGDDALLSALRGGLIVLKPIGSDPSDEEWKFVMETFRRAGGEDEPPSMVKVAPS
jgi:hypothetical protein